VKWTPNPSPFLVALMLGFSFCDLPKFHWFMVLLWSIMLSSALVYGFAVVDDVVQCTGRLVQSSSRAHFFDLSLHFHADASQGCLNLDVL